MSNAVLNRSEQHRVSGLPNPDPVPEHTDFTDFLNHLAAFVPEDCILTRPEDTRPFECDGLSLYRTTPPVVVLPENEAQVVAVMNACRQHGVPLVPRGAGTGLSGGALPIADGVLFGLYKCNMITRRADYSTTSMVEPG